MKNLIIQVEQLRRAIKRKEREIDNPTLTLSILSELEFFAENIKDS